MRKSLMVPVVLAALCAAMLLGGCRCGGGGGGMAPNVTPAAATVGIVELHGWNETASAATRWSGFCAARGWAHVAPEFGLPVGSEAGIEVILESARGLKRQGVERVYLIGVSGGGLMALLAGARAPELFDRIAAWVPMTDLAAWYRENGTFAAALGSALGGTPDEVPEVYAARSPMTWWPLSRQDAAPTIYLYAGMWDMVVDEHHAEDLYAKICGQSGLSGQGDAIEYEVTGLERKPTVAAGTYTCPGAELQVLDMGHDYRVEETNWMD